MKRIMTSAGITCSTPFSVNDKKRTIPGLAVTPRQVAELTARGIPVSTQGIAEYYDSDKGWRVEPMFSRGADICQLWEMEKKAQARVLSARKQDKLRFG